MGADPPPRVGRCKKKNRNFAMQNPTRASPNMTPNACSSRVPRPQIATFPPQTLTCVGLWRCLVQRVQTGGLDPDIDPPGRLPAERQIGNWWRRPGGGGIRPGRGSMKRRREEQFSRCRGAVGLTVPVGTASADKVRCVRKRPKTPPRNNAQGTPFITTSTETQTSACNSNRTRGRRRPPRPPTGAGIRSRRPAKSRGQQQGASPGAPLQFLRPLEATGGVAPWKASVHGTPA